MKDWILSMVKLSDRCGFHNHLCWQTSFPIIWGVNFWWGAKKVPSLIFRPKTPTNLMGSTKAMCQAPLFSTKIMAIWGIQPTTMFCLATTLCESGGTPNVVVRLEDSFVPPIVPHPISKTNHNMEVFKVQLERGINSSVLSRQGIVGFMCLTINVGQNCYWWFWIDKCWF